MKIDATALPEVKLLTPRRFEDGRGFFSETYNRERLAAAGIAVAFVQDNQSLSRRRGTIRGLHYQMAPMAQAKLVRVLRGAILDVAVDIRPGSATFGQHVAVELDAERGSQLFVPEGFAHGFCTLADDTEIFYKVSRPYAPDCERGILWSDPTLGIAWPVRPEAAVVSDKDRSLPPLARAL
jgi:dTDP-4-dehydrorhamnose 3,5-epimerase